ncbi:MAG: homoserine dehydrogenase [Chitinispirillaceae bacterium]|nr:homoserine dehydrogenase [Chitinispirillaceae bacterium]
MQEIRIGLVGAGTVGGGVVKLAHTSFETLCKKQGLPVRIAWIVDKDPGRFKLLPVGQAHCSGDPQDILNDASIQVVIELVGGTTHAKDLILAALKRKKHVITANKALLAEHGPEIFAEATRAGVSVYFEAAVGGGMPVIKTIREALAGNEIRSVTTIINGTCNYILTKMFNEGQPFETVLKKTQLKGYAEADPSLDVGGGDTGHKLAILASLISNGYVPYAAVSIEGITSIAKEDIAYARELGYTIKLLGIIKKEAGQGGIEVRVHPAMLNKHHILASVSGVYNAVLLEGDAVGQILLYGKGAGEMPTASSVISDVVDIARNIAAGQPIRVPMEHYTAEHVLTPKPIEEIRCRYYLRFTVIDRPGVLASIAGFLGAENISLASVMQKEVTAEKRVPVIILTHTAQEKNMRSALSRIETMDYVKSPTQVIRIED